MVNWEVVLSKDLADRGLRPPIDPHRSGTRREERLLTPLEIERRGAFRSELSGELLEDALKLLTWANNTEGVKVASESLKKRAATKIPSGVTPGPAPSEPVRRAAGSRRPVKG